MNRAQALRELELLEKSEFDQGDASSRLLQHLHSDDTEVLHAALRASVNYFGFPGIYERVFDLACHAEDEDLRAASNAALWPVMLDGAVYDRPVEPGQEPDAGVPREIYETVRDHLLEKVDAPMESMEVRRRCLEALGHISFLPNVRAIILRFYREAPNPWVKLSAVYAMGLNHDEIFERFIMNELHSKYDGVVVEAIHAAASLRLEATWPRIRELTSHVARDVRFEAIAAVGSLAPVSEAEGLLEELGKHLGRAEHYAEAFTAAHEALDARKAEASGDDWNIENVWSEIDEMTGSDDDDSYGSASDGYSSRS